MLGKRMDIKENNRQLYKMKNGVNERVNDSVLWLFEDVERRKQASKRDGA